MKKLIIVCEEKLRRYGDFLAQLISVKDDKDGTIVGISDGTAAAQVWLEKDYITNSAQISSEQYILFIGNSKLITEKRHHMQKKYSEYGMNYGWLGKQAVLFVDYVLSHDEYDEFYNLLSNKYTEGNQKKAVKLLISKSEEINKSINDNDGIIEMDSSEIVDNGNHIQQEVKGVKKPLAPLDFVGKTFKKAIDAGVKKINKISDNINAAAKSKEIEEQQYTCLILNFYLNDLSAFLELDKE